MDRYPYYKYTILLGATRALVHISIHFTHRIFGLSTGLILTSPDGIDVEYALRFSFQASNNEVEYEVVIAGLNLPHSMEDDQLEVSSDSQLVVKQIEDSYEARGEKMILYLKKVRYLLKNFIRVQVKDVPRAENSRANALENWQQPHKKT